MNELEYSLEEMLPLLKNHIIFFSISEGRKKYFHYYNKLILVLDGKSRYKLKIDDFKTLFKDSKFYVYEDDTVEIDIEKDKEYYSWRQ